MVTVWAIDSRSSEVWATIDFQRLEVKTVAGASLLSPVVSAVQVSEARGPIRASWMIVSSVVQPKWWILAGISKMLRPAASSPFVSKSSQPHVERARHHCHGHLTDAQCGGSDVRREPEPYGERPGLENDPQSTANARARRQHRGPAVT